MQSKRLFGLDCPNLKLKGITAEVPLLQATQLQEEEPQKIHQKYRVHQRFCQRAQVCRKVSTAKINPVTSTTKTD